MRPEGIERKLDVGTTGGRKLPAPGGGIRGVAEEISMPEPEAGVDLILCAYVQHPPCGRIAAKHYEAVERPGQAKRLYNFSSLTDKNVGLRRLGPKKQALRGQAIIGTSLF